MDQKLNSASNLNELVIRIKGKRYEESREKSKKSWKIRQTSVNPILRQKFSGVGGISPMGRIGRLGDSATPFVLLLLLLMLLDQTSVGIRQTLDPHH